MGILYSSCRRAYKFVYDENYDQDVPTGSGEPSDDVTNRRVCQELWDMDARLTPGTDYEISPNGSALFTRVKQSFLSSDLIQKFQELLLIYHSDRLQMTYTRDEERKQQDFINTVLSTKVMRRCFEVLHANGQFAGSLEDFRRELCIFWFRLHNFHNIDTCTFEHVFVGERAGYNVEGFHNWIQYYIQQQKGVIKNYRWQGAVSPRLATMSFTWKGKAKPKDSMFIGTTPAFEMALYTYLYFAGRTTANSDGNGINNIQLSGTSVKVVVVTRDSKLVTAYPEA